MSFRLSIRNRSRFCLCIAMLALQTVSLTDGFSSCLADEVQADSKKVAAKPKHETLRLTGKVVYVSELLERRFGIATVREAQERILALETKDGQFYPIIENERGRAFRVDDRLRKMTVELVVRKFEQSPMIQIVQVFELKDKKKFIVDYWCDECAIVMYESIPCDCCQDHNRLRKRLVTDSVR